jgi:hypothetical protein
MSPTASKLTRRLGVGVGIPVGARVAVSVIVDVGVSEAEAAVGVSFAGRNGVRVSLAVGGSGLSTKVTAGAAQPVNIAARRIIRMRMRLFLILYLDLQLHLPDGFQ